MIVQKALCWGRVNTSGSIDAVWLDEECVMFGDELVFSSGSVCRVDGFRCLVYLPLSLILWLVLSDFRPSGIHVVWIPLSRPIIYLWVSHTVREKS